MSSAQRKPGPAYWQGRITRCETLVQGWDSYDAVPPTPEVITKAREFLALVIEKDAPIDRLNATVVGGIGFTFREARDSAEPNNETLSAYVEFRNTETCHALYIDPAQDVSAAPAHKIETTKKGYEQLLEDIVLYLREHDEQARSGGPDGEGVGPGGAV
jgi:hypothetical protein